MAALPVLEILATIKPLTALAIMASVIVSDGLHALYTEAIGRGRDAAAATVGAAIYVFTAFAVVQYTQNNAYLAFVVIGSWIGTYGSLKVQRWCRIRRERRSGNH
ncbi:hypothetical protein [Rhizobium sp. BK176]|uniref:hypothetical protein n=1 Tax=Rhizobium sp. BK176 TaxID=2587071 RepID=UPI0021677F01|nr:hypothetical protein [Rhizobium sp. BK176]MCS4088549.1 hypothetical protein [Rhizobium sp. BK176]